MRGLRGDGEVRSFMMMSRGRMENDGREGQKVKRVLDDDDDEGQGVLDKTG